MSNCKSYFLPVRFCFFRAAVTALQLDTELFATRLKIHPAWIPRRCAWVPLGTFVTLVVLPQRMPTLFGCTVTVFLTDPASSSTVLLLASTVSPLALQVAIC